MSELKVLVVMGSENDLSAMKPAWEALQELDVPWEVAVASAHRAPDRVAALAAEARGRGIGAIVAGAGLAHHLAGALAARTTLPVIAVPLASGALQGIDSLLSAVQMPPGVPVATVGVGASRNAGLLAAQVLGIRDEALAGRLDALRQAQAAGTTAADLRVQRALRGAP